MAKRIALFDYIEVDGVDISNFCRSYNFTSEHEQVDVSGFSATGANESLAGQTVQSVELEVFGSYGTGEIYDILYPIHRDRSVVTFKHRPNQNNAVSGTNPQLEGNIQILTWAEGATRGEVEAFPVTLAAADEDGLTYVET